jgi:hypothetical protein
MKAKKVDYSRLRTTNTICDLRMNFEIRKANKQIIDLSQETGDQVFGGEASF